MTPDYADKDLEDVTCSLESREAFAEFIEQVAKDFSEHQDEWENLSLPEFLNGMAGFCRQMDGYYANQNLNVDCSKPSWQVFGDMLLAARVFE